MERIGMNALLCAFFCILIGCGGGRSRTVAPENSGVWPIDSFPQEEHGSYYCYEAIRALHLQKNPTHAIDLLNRSIALDSTADLPYYLLAVAYGDSLSVALHYLQQAARNDSANVWYQYRLGELYATTRQYDKALETYRRIARLQPGNPEVIHYIAALYERSGLPYAAISELDSAQAKFGKREEFHGYKRELLLRLQLYDRAFDEAKQLAEMAPDDVRNQVVLGEIYAQRGRDSLALEAFTQAMDADPENVDAIASINNFYLNRKDFPNFLKTARALFARSEVPVQNKIKYFNDYVKSAEMYQNYFFLVNDVASTLLATHPEDSSVRELYVQHLINSGRLDDARALYSRWSQESPSNASYIKQVIDIEIYQKKIDSAEIHLNKALHEFPRDLDLHFKKVFLLSERKEYDQALSQLKKSLRYASNDSLRSVVYGNMGDLTHQAGKTDYRYYDKALKLDSMNILVLNNYSYFLSLEGRELDKAVGMAERMMRADINNPTYLDTYAWVIFRAGRVDEAKKIMRQAISLDSSRSPDLLLHYGDILFESGDDYMASIYWRKALEAGAPVADIEARMKRLQEKQKEEK